MFASRKRVICRILYGILLVLMTADKSGVGSNEVEVRTVSILPLDLGNTSTIASTTMLDEDEDEWDDEDDGSSSAEIDDEGRIYKNPRNSPSPQCPRDMEQANILGQKCLRKCYADEDCKSKRKKCLCDGACGMSCIKPDRECPEPERIALGAVQTNGGRLFGSRAIYSCPHGYHVVGLQSRQCQADGKWSGSAPACKQNIYCLAPPTIDHARHNALPEQTTFDLDTQLQYYCHMGYVTNGFPRAKCLTVDGQASWYGPDIACEPRSCGTPVDIAHGWHAGECYTYGCRITYHCADGYELVGRNERYCQGDGSWSPKDLPICVLVTAVRCNIPDHPKHGKAVYTSCSYNSVVSYECKYGYVLVGENTRRCGADKNWSGIQPYCKEINCGHPGRVWNGWLENIEGGTGLGASIIFRCRDGMLLVGNSSTVCQIDGKWRYPVPKCLAPCVVPHVTHGRVRTVSGGNETTVSTATVVPHGDELYVECDGRYEFVPDGSAVTCNNGTWTHIPRCQPARCKQLPKPPKYGMVIVPKMEHGMRARFMCKDGFELKGEPLIECSYGQWLGEPPKCEEVYCPYPGLVLNGKILLVGNMGLYDYRPYVRKVVNNKQIMYECDKGYDLISGPPGATCISGQWSPRELPRCELGQHPKIRVNRRRRRKRDLQIIGEGPLWRIKRALKGGSSSRTLGTAHRGSSSSISLRRGNKKMKTAYEEEEDEKKAEQRAKLPCDPLQSDLFVNIEVVRYGKDRNATFSSGTVVKMACGKGYELNMPENRTAKCVKGKWRPTKPLCLLVPCFVPYTVFGVYTVSGKGLPENSTLNIGDYLNETDRISNGQVVNFGCEPGYAVQGPRNLRCWHGEWAVSTFPECTPAPCQLPQISHGEYGAGYRGGLTIANGSSVEFQCDGDYIKSTAQAVTCVLGALHPRNPSCRSADEPPEPPPTRFVDVIGGHSCGPPNRVHGSLVFRNGEPMITTERSFPHGTEVRFNCIENVMGDKNAWKIVCEDGTWIGKALSCGDDRIPSLGNVYGNGTCIFRNQEPNVVSFYNDREISEDVVELPANSILVSRCTDIGKYQMVGSARRACVNGDWNGTKPVCFGLNQENDYSVEKPPTILFRHLAGPIGQSNDGQLVVYPGTILHMECLWMRKYGSPKWNVTHDYRTYPEGWATDEGRDAQLEYRLSIMHAVKDDSGQFTCMTPARYSHSVNVIVKAVHCPHIAPLHGLTMSTEETKMGTEVKFNCLNGNQLVGSADVTCQPSGNWSAPVPTCEKARCNHPGAPENGYMQGNAPFRAGTVVQFNCHPNFMMEGQPIIACQENAQWSAKVPKCVPACSYPGTTISGRMSSVKFYYKIGENITFTCDEGLTLKGAAILKCQRSGKWSNAIPTCVKNVTNSATNVNNNTIKT